MQQKVYQLLFINEATVLEDTVHPLHVIHVVRPSNLSESSRFIQKTIIQTEKYTTKKKLSSKKNMNILAENAIKNSQDTIFWQNTVFCSTMLP